MKTAIFLANGYEEIEALTVVDLLRRVKISCDMIATEDDIELSDVDLTYRKYITITPLNFLRTNEDILKNLLDESKNFK